MQPNETSFILDLWVLSELLVCLMCLGIHHPTILSSSKAPLSRKRSHHSSHLTSLHLIRTKLNWTIQFRWDKMRWDEHWTVLYSLCESLHHCTTFDCHLYISHNQLNHPHTTQSLVHNLLADWVTFQLIQYKSFQRLIFPSLSLG